MKQPIIININHNNNSTITIANDADHNNDQEEYYAEKSDVAHFSSKKGGKQMKQPLKKQSVTSKNDWPGFTTTA